MHKPSSTMRFLFAAVVLFALGTTLEDVSSSEALALFKQRIMPISRSSQPSSRVQCHLASVALKNYIFPSPEKMFVSLRDQGLIDLASREQSKILTLIQMGEKDLDGGGKLIHAKTRQAEYDAFSTSRPIAHAIHESSRVQHGVQYVDA